MKSENTHHCSLSKKERIVSQKLVDELFGGHHSHSMVAYPLRAVFINKVREREEEPPVQVLMSVPKRRFKHAVDRNRVKRQLREAFRHHKDILGSVLPADKAVALAFIWLSDQHVPSATVDQRVVILLERIAKWWDPSRPPQRGGVAAPPLLPEEDVTGRQLGQDVTGQQLGQDVTGRQLGEDVTGQQL